MTERQMDVRTDGQMHVRRGTITLDECLFCNIIKSVKHDKTESRISRIKYLSYSSYSVKVDIIVSMNVSLKSSEGRMMNIHTGNNRHYNQSSQ